MKVATQLAKYGCIHAVVYDKSRKIAQLIRYYSWAKYIEGDAIPVQKTDWYNALRANPELEIKDVYEEK